MGRSAGSYDKLSALAVLIPKDTLMPRTIQLPLDIADVEVLSTDSKPNGSLIIKVETTLKTAHRRGCGREIDRFHGHDKAIELCHLPMFDRPVHIQPALPGRPDDHAAL
jgi:hypothetical protein